MGVCGFDRLTLSRSIKQVQDKKLRPLFQKIDGERLKCMSTGITHGFSQHRKKINPP
jgi:hypothetical protein